MLNKNRSLLNGVYLSSAIAMCLPSISSDVVAEKSIRNLRSKLNQLSWNLFCNKQEHRIQTDNLGDAEWVLDDAYKYSRIAVIGKAIGDCIAGENEFYGRSASDIIIFPNQEPEHYNQSNWNAVILYNYVHEAINNSNIPDSAYYTRHFSNVGAALQHKLPMIKNAYATRYRNKRGNNADELLNGLNQNLDKAIRDIQQYVSALQLHHYLQFFRKSRLDYASNRSIDALAPQVINCSDGHGEAVRCSVPFSPIETGTEITRTEYRPLLRYHEGGLYLADLSITKQIWDTNAQCRKTLPNTQLSDADKIKHCKWMLARLDPLVKLPPPELLLKWGKITQSSTN